MVTHISKGKCILCGDSIYESEKYFESEEGFCHQRCLYSSKGAVTA